MRTNIARTLLKGGLAFLVVPAVLVVTTALSPFGSEPESHHVSSFVAHVRPDGQTVSFGLPYGLPCATVLSDVDLRDDAVVVSLRTTFDRPYGGPDVFGCFLDVELDEPVGARPIVDGWCVEALGTDTPQARAECQRWPRRW